MLLHSYLSEVHDRWEDRIYVTKMEQLEPLPSRAPWIPYEEYMEAQLIKCVTGEIGHLRIRFPAHTTENNRRHLHPASARIVTVESGTGKFVALRKGVEVHHELTPLNRVYIPEGILHTFCAGPEGMVVQALHLPWIPLEDTRSLQYPK